MPEVVSDGVDAAVVAAGQADAAVVVVGSHPFVYGRENHDRTDLALGRSQQELVDAVTAANPNTVVVLETSYPTTFDNQPETLLWTTHAGSETGNAVADVVFGDENPAGRLTQTWYAGVDDLPSIDRLRHRQERLDVHVLRRRSALPVRPRAVVQHVRLLQPEDIRHVRGRRR